MSWTHRETQRQESGESEELECFPCDVGSHVGNCGPYPKMMQKL